MQSVVVLDVCFFFKQKTAYEMRISDWSSDVCSSDLLWGGISIFMMITAARRADRPTASFMFFRLLAVVFLAIDLVKGATMEEWAGSGFWLFVLIAEYAATIRTLPPVETSKIAAKASVAK